MQDDYFVIDTVAHMFDMRPENFAEPRYAAPVNGLLQTLFNTAPEGYQLEFDASVRDWTPEETANLTFKESYTDVAVCHTTPIYFYKDGLSGFEKSLEATRKYPNRYIGAYIAADPLHGQKAIDSMVYQADALENPMGLKLYPISWNGKTTEAWRLDDPKIAYPLYEKAMELGLNTVAVHKSIPLGPAPSADAFHPGDVERAADQFPELNFEIVHGGAAFTEETAWLLARYQNIWINLETTNIILGHNERAFAEILGGLMHAGGEGVLDRVVWASGSMNCHPRPSLERFAAFQFPEDVLEKYGAFLPVPQLTSEHKRKILSENYARLHGLDIEKLKAGIAGDEFSQAQAQGLAEPWSTTSVADQVIRPKEASHA
jgi:predicted TIM-barrel fold metal-dependent hydrolase